MEIWLINHYAVTPEFSGGTRHFEIGRELVRRGHKLTLFASSFHHNTHKHVRRHVGLSPVIEDYDGLRFVWVPGMGYRGNSVKRLLGMLHFCLMLFPIALKMKPRPDIVVGSSVHPFAALAGWALARFFGVPAVTEIRDLWPQTLIESGISARHPFILLLAMVERFLYRYSDSIVTLLPKAEDYISARGAKAVHWIPNGIDMDSYSPPYLQEESDVFTVLYAGALGHANNLEVLIEAARLLEGEPVRFLVVGEGPEKEKLAELSRGVTNFELRPSVPKREIPELLRSAGALIFHLRSIPVFRYGISPNKLWDYLAAGRPIVFACEAGNDPVAEAGAGLSVPPEDPQALAQAVLTLSQMTPEQRFSMGCRGYEYGLQNHSFRMLGERFEKVLNSSRETL